MMVEASFHIRGLQEDSNATNNTSSGEQPDESKGGGLSYGTFAALSVVGIIAFIALSILAIVVYKRLKYRVSLAGGKTHFFFIYDERNQEAEVKADQAREWLRLQGYKSWFDLMANANAKMEGVSRAAVVVLFLTPGILKSQESMDLVRIAAERNKPIVLLATDDYVLEDRDFSSACSEQVKTEILPVLLSRIEPILFTYKSESRVRNSNPTGRALEAAFLNKKQFIFQRLKKGTGSKVAVAIVPLNDVESDL